MTEKNCRSCKKRVVLKAVKCLECDHLWHRSCAKKVRCLRRSNGLHLICSAHMEDTKKIGQKRKTLKEVANGNCSKINENMEDEDEVVEDIRLKNIKEETVNHSINSQKVKDEVPEPREIQYLLDIIDCKNELITELRDKINILETHLALYE